MVWFRAYNAEVAARLRSSVDAQDDDGRTALMFAAKGSGLFGSRRGNLTIARDLLALGADLSLQDKQGLTALGFAIRSNDTDKNNEMVEFLQQEMVKEEAMRSFKQRHSYRFDEKGHMELIDRQGQKTPSQSATRQEMPTRYRKARADATLGGLQATVETTFGLPSGSVRLINPDGRKLRSDATVGTLRKAWGED
nr:ankyrin repeat domain-containing protein [Microvirga pakistanensis]